MEAFMIKVIDQLSNLFTAAFVACGYEEKYGVVTISNRPDLCQYQCNGALAAAKQYKKAPIMIANEIVERCKENPMLKEITAIMPGFINFTVKEEYLVDYLDQMAKDERLGCDQVENPDTVVVDYGGPNVAKPLHVGHLRPAIIGESIKRMVRFLGHNVIGDAHLGDWGTQMGLIIAEVRKRQPNLPYFDESYTGEYPSEAPFTISELEEIYPTASEYSKANPEFREEAKEIVFQLQNGHRGYTALWNHIMTVSVNDLKKNYDNLGVHFDVWKKESDAQPYIPEMVTYLKDNGYAKISEGALVVDVKEETDTKEIPPCMILKSDGASLYATTDLATLVERMKLFNPASVIYVVDKRQELHFELVFRCVKKTKLVPDDVNLTFLGFGTMNGKDGKPFKTRDGGVMRLEYLMDSINEEVYKKIMSNREMEEEEARKVAKTVGLAALKYGDLSNQASKDYIFDIDRFTSFEGNTGPYILYTMVRIKSILAKYQEEHKEVLVEDLLIKTGNTREYGTSEVNLMLECVKFNDVIEHAANETAPHKLCAYIYDLANAFSTFYHENKIIAEEEKEKQQEWIALINLVLRILTTCIELLGFSAPEKM